MVNANDKRQVISDHALHDIGFYSIASFLQLFYLKNEDESIVAALSKILNDFLVYSEEITVDNVVNLLRKSFLMELLFIDLLGYATLALIYHSMMTTPSPSMVMIS